MRLLSIETSCDDTAIALMKVSGPADRATFEIVANASNSQIPIHREYGGVFPNLAKRAHIENLPLLLDVVLKKAKVEGKKKPVDAIAVTYGPGLEPSLWTGIVFAKELAEKWQVPLIPTNHMEGHIVSAFGKDKGKFKIPKINFPILSLLVSGGHTELVISKSLTKHKIIGRTLDDAAGEAFDKAARMMDLPYPGGPEISKLAEGARKESEESSYEGLQFSLPRPMLHSKDFNFSFSGLKTAVLYLIRKIGKLDDEKRKAISLEFENAVIETLVYKTQKAVEKYKVNTLIVGGGVACNTHLQREMNNTLGKEINVLFPPRTLTGDNAIMVGMAGYLTYLKNGKKGKRLSNIKATGNLSLS